MATQEKREPGESAKPAARGRDGDTLPSVHGMAGGPSNLLGARALPGGRARQATRVFLQLALIALAAHHAAITVTQYLANQFYTHDVGHLDYMFYYTWHGRFFWSIVYEISHFAKHFTPSLVLLVPVHALSRHVLCLPILEGLAVVSGAWAVAWMFDGVLRRGRGRMLLFQGRGAGGARLSPLGLAAGWLYVCNPYTGSVLLANHFESFAVGLSLWALAALANGKKNLFWLLLVLALGVKEDLALGWIAFGAWWVFFGWERPRRGPAGRRAGLACALRGGGAATSVASAALPPFPATSVASAWKTRLRLGAAIMAVSAAWLVLALLSVRAVARLSDVSSLEYARRYEWLGGTPLEALENVVFRSRLLWTIPYRAGALFLWTVLFLPLLAPSTLLALIPAVYLMGLSGRDTMSEFMYYYSYPVLPFLCLGAVLGLSRVARWSGRVARKRKGARGRGPYAGATIVIFLSGVLLLLQPTHTDGKRRLLERPRPRHSWIRLALREAIPPDASVCAQFDLLCQMPHRREIYPLSEKNLDRADYWVLDRKGFLGDVDSLAYQRILNRAAELVRAGRARIVVDRSDLLIVRRLRESPKGAGGEGA
jgi:hypothetical protein